MAEDGRGEKDEKQGGFRALPFILGSEICNKFAVAEFFANMDSYLTTQLHMPLLKAANTLSNLSGTANLTPVAGALLTDIFTGRFWAITIGIIFYQLGMMSLTISALLPALQPPYNLLILYVSLLFSCIGTGFTRRCTAAFGVDQFKLAGRRKMAAGAEKSTNLFNLYTFTLGLSLLLALTVVVYIQDNVGWGWGFGIPSTAIFLSGLGFVMGYPRYVNVRPVGSPLIRLDQVLVAACRKRNLPMPEDPSRGGSTLRQMRQSPRAPKYSGAPKS